MDNGKKTNKYGVLNLLLCAMILVCVVIILAFLIKGSDQNTEDRPTPTPIIATAEPTPTPDVTPTGDPTATPDTTPTGDPTATPTAAPTPTPGQIGDVLTEAELAALHVNEAGDIPVVMWHQFSDADSPEYSTGTRQYMNSFDYLYDLCERLYNAGFRLLSMSDYLNNNITVPAGCKPIVFAFDDGVSSQFSLIEKNGQLELNPKCAVYVMQQFANVHPDFGFTGIIYVYLHSTSGVFEGAGTIGQRLNYLIDLGWEIGNHTYGHRSLRGLSAADISYQLGKNQQVMESYVPGYKFNSLALPYGEYDDANVSALISGTYEGITYQNKAIFLVGAEPSHATTSVNFKVFVPRIRSTGYYAERMDFEWWLENQPEHYWFVSDGDANTVTCPETWANYVTDDLPNGQKLRTY